MKNFIVPETTLPFLNYIDQCRALIEQRRTDLHALSTQQTAAIVAANSPFEWPPFPPSTAGRRTGVLLIQGLFDCPFSLRDLGARLQAQGVFCRSVLLPGHGTTPSDLLQVTYQDWLHTVRYGIETFQQEVDQLFLIGYSTGAALSVYHALQEHAGIAGILLLAPALKVKLSVHVFTAWQTLIKNISKNQQWLLRSGETDYVKYHSITFNAVAQIIALTEVVEKLLQTHTLSCPVWMSVSDDDEVISSRAAVQFFQSQSHPASRLLLYTTKPRREYDIDSRIIQRTSSYPALHIRHFSHVAMPFAPDNMHYGQHGDYVAASHPEAKDYIYGAYNFLTREWYENLYQLNLVQKKRGELTYNPDFDWMAEQVIRFVKA